MKTIYSDKYALVIDKPAGIDVFSESLASQLPKELPRNGIVHRLDKDTSGILLVAKTAESLIFFQKQFKQRRVEKKYIALVIGNLKDERRIETLIGRNPGERKKEKVFLKGEPGSERKREAVTEYKVLKRFKEYTLIEAKIETGRKHQIRVHLSYLGHPLAGDKKYGFKNQPCPKGLKRQFLHAGYLKISFPEGDIKEFSSKLPEELEKILKEI